MTDLSTFSAQAEHYSAVRSRLMKRPDNERRHTATISADQRARIVRVVSAWPPQPYTPPVVPIVSFKGQVIEFDPTALEPTMFDRISAILHEVSEKYKIPIREIKSDHRWKELMPARYEAYYRLWDELGISLSRVGHIMGRDHTTILHGIRRHTVRMHSAAE